MGTTRPAEVSRGVPTRGGVRPGAARCSRGRPARWRARRAPASGRRRSPSRAPARRPPRPSRSAAGGRWSAAGPTHWATGRSSKPTTLRSSGMWRRASRAAWYTPSAWRSLPAKMAVGPVREREQRAAAVDPLLHVELAVADQLRVDRHAGLVHRRAVAVEPRAAAQDPCRAADDADPPMARAPAGAASPSGRRSSWSRRSTACRAAARRSDRRSRTGCRASRSWARMRLAEVGEDGDHAGRAARQDALDPAAARVAGGPASPRGRPPAGAGPRPARPPDDLQRPLALEFVENDLQQRRSARRARRPLVAAAPGSPPRRVGASPPTRPPGR